MPRLFYQRQWYAKAWVTVPRPIMGGDLVTGADEIMFTVVSPFPGNRPGEKKVGSLCMVRRCG
jgi:hypothetical protein